MDARAGQEAPSAKRCIKTDGPLAGSADYLCSSQKAPSAKRCIKTVSGATGRRGEGQTVRKHRAPKGALRHEVVQRGVSTLRSESTERQKVH